MTIAEIKSEFAKLSPEDQDRLVTELVAMMVPPEVPEWHKEILKQRMADAEANPDDTRPADEVFAELEKQLRDRRLGIITSETDVPDWHADELDRRLADPDLLKNAIPWEEAKQKLGWE